MECEARSDDTEEPSAPSARWRGAQSTEHRAQWTSDVLLLYTPPLYHRHSQFVKVKPERDDSHVGGGGRDLLCGAEQAGSH